MHYVVIAHKMIYFSLTSYTIEVQQTEGKKSLFKFVLNEFGDEELEQLLSQ